MLLQYWNKWGQSSVYYTLIAAHVGESIGVAPVVLLDEARGAGRFGDLEREAVSAGAFDVVAHMG